MAIKATSKLITSRNIRKGFFAGYYLLMHKIKGFPLAVNYDLTWQCNLKCKHCYFNSSAEELSTTSAKKRAELTDDQWIKVFKYHKKFASNG